MHRTLRSPPVWSCRRLRKVQQTRLVQQVRQEGELGLIGTKDFAHQYDTQ
jgi:hypothetical protein